MTDGGATLTNNTDTGGGTISMDGSPSLVPLARAWARDYQRACLTAASNSSSSGVSFTITSSNSRVAAQRLCALPGFLPVDIALMSRPFMSTEASVVSVINNRNDNNNDNNITIPNGSSISNNNNNSNKNNYQCEQGNVSRTAIQVEVATDAIVLVVAPNGTAAYCIQELYDNGLTLEQLRILFSSYTLEQLLGINTTSTTLAPSTSVAPSRYHVVVATPNPNTPTIIPSLAPTLSSPTLNQPPTTVSEPTNPTISPSTSIPSFIPLSTPAFTPFQSPSLKPIRRPTPPTLRPTLPTSTLRTVHWLFFPHPRPGSSFGATTICSTSQVLLAGPPTTSETFETFFQRVLPDIGNGETISPIYYAGRSVKQIVRYLKNNTNAIGFLSLANYLAYQNKLTVVPLKDVYGENQSPVNQTTVAGGRYPLFNNLYMNVRSDDPTTLDRIRPFLAFGFSSQPGNADVLDAGLVPLAESRRQQQLEQLGVDSRGGGGGGGGGGGATSTIHPTIRRATSAPVRKSSTPAPGRASATIRPIRTTGAPVKKSTPAPVMKPNNNNNNNKKPTMPFKMNKHQ